MSKSVQIAIVLGLLVCLTLGQSVLKGYTNFDIRTDNHEECFYSIYGHLIPTELTLSQLYRPVRVGPPAQPPAFCYWHNFEFDSIFHGEDLCDELEYMNSTDPNNLVINATFNPNALYRNNGTACVSLPQTERPGVDQYLCRVIYDVTPLYFAVWGTGNFSFDVSLFDSPFFIQSAENSRVISLQANVIGLNYTFPTILANLTPACGSTGNITNLTTAVTVSSAIDLSAHLPGFWLAYTVIKPYGASVGQYKVVVTQSNTTLFNTAGNCWSMGVNYSDLVPDMNYCAQGCSVSFILTDAQSRIYDLKTTGVYTAPNSGNVGGGNGGNGGNGSGNGGNGGNGGNNGGNGGNGGAANSALSMSFNMVLLLFSYVYLVHF